MRGIDENSMMQVNSNKKSMAMYYVFEKFDAEDMKRFLIENCKKQSRLRSTVISLFGLFYFSPFSDSEFENHIEHTFKIWPDSKIHTDKELS
jgi:hypothetical protein